MDDTSLHFAQSIWIIVGLIVCLGIIVLFIRFDRRREADLMKLIHPRFRQRLTEGFSPWRRNLKRGLWVLAVLLLFVAVARPQMGYEWREVKRKGIDIVFAVDTSRSMLAEDLTPSRLERARLGIIDFVGRLEGDRVGLIPFAGSAFALCPLTLDYQAFRESLDVLDTDLIPRQGTDLASAIKEAERLFDENGNNHRVLVMLTDGEDLQGDVIDAAKAAAKKGMAIYTVGVGSPEGATIPLVLGNGRKDFVRDESGKVVKTTLDEATLEKIAEVTNGLYVRLGRGAEGLNTIYQEKLRMVPKSELNQRMERIPLERLEWPLGFAIGILLLEFFIGDRKRVQSKKFLTIFSSKSKVVPPVALVIGMGCLAVTSLKGQSADSTSVTQDARRVYNEGTDAYNKGEFTKASESLRTSLRTQDVKLQQQSYYNLGNSLYRTGQGTLEKDPEATIKTWQEALKAYEDALALDDLDEDSTFNKNLVAKKLEELKKQQKKDEDKKDEDKKDEDKKDEDKKDGDKKDGDKKDEDKKDGDKKDGDKSEDGKDPKEGEKPDDGKDPKDDAKPEEAKDSKDGKKQENSKDGQESKDSKDSEKPGDEKSQQDSKEAKDSEAKDGEKSQGEVSNERAAKQEMTPDEAKQLLEALREDERTVIPIP
ncbi:MAG: VWA domain-containing protein, partial [Akkermansiaceae bacterium]|nr:VWA domain-containing protein [Akkermansiaceae bacterium]